MNLIVPVFLINKRIIKAWHLAEILTGTIHKDSPLEKIDHILPFLSSFKIVRACDYNTVCLFWAFPGQTVRSTDNSTRISVSM